MRHLNAKTLIWSLEKKRKLTQADLSSTRSCLCRVESAETSNASERRKKKRQSGAHFGKKNKRFCTPKLGEKVMHQKADGSGEERQEHRQTTKCSKEKKQKHKNR